MDEDDDELLPPLIDYDGATDLEEIIRDRTSSCVSTLASHVQVRTLLKKCVGGGGGVTLGNQDERKRRNPSRKKGREESGRLEALQ